MDIFHSLDLKVWRQGPQVEADELDDLGFKQGLIRHQPTACAPAKGSTECSVALENPYLGLASFVAGHGCSVNHEPADEVGFDETVISLDELCSMAGRGLQVVQRLVGGDLVGSILVPADPVCMGGPFRPRSPEDISS